MQFDEQKPGWCHPEMGSWYGCFLLITLQCINDRELRVSGCVIGNEFELKLNIEVFLIGQTVICIDISLALLKMSSPAPDKNSYLLFYNIWM